MQKSSKRSGGQLFWGLMTVIGLLCIPLHISAQLNGDLPKVTSAYYLQNVNVVSSPGVFQENTNILIEDGMIQTIGSRTPIPSHARVVQCDSMYVYAGFIEGISHTGIPSRDKNSNNNGNSDGPKQKIDRGNPPNDLAGITPEQTIRDLYKSTEKSVSNMRKLGFTASHVVPRDGMLPGMGSLMLLGDGDADEQVLKENVSMFLQLRPARRIYPATVIGVMAKWREMYTQAEYMKKHKGTFDGDNTGIGRPQYDRATEALFPVVSGDIPVFFKTPSALDAYKAFMLQDDLGFEMTLVELKEGWRISDELTSRNTPVLVSMDLPEDQGEKKNDKEKDKSKGKDKPDNEEASDMDKSDSGEKGMKKDEVAAKEVDKEKEELMRRRQESLLEHYSQAAVLSEAGVPLSFSMLSMKSKDFHANVRKMIENGLSTDTVLAALTTVPAKMLGVDKYVGTVTAGKMANLVVSSGPYFEEKSQVRYVFVEGVMYEYEIKEKKDKKKSGGKPAEITGDWAFEVEIPGDTQTGIIAITGNDGDFKGTLTPDDEPDETSELYDIVIDGNQWTFSMDMESDGGSLTIEFDLIIDDDTFSGDASAGEAGTFPISGERNPNP